MEDVFNFEDFIGEGQKQKFDNFTEKLSQEIKDKTIEPEAQDDTSDEEVIEEVDKELEKVEETIEGSQEEILNESLFNEDDDFYTLYKDKSELFSCDIYVEGAKTDETVTRIIVESNDWTLMFPGEIENGKVEIPIRKLNIFEEGQVGKIRLEVIAEGSLFIPWEDDFKVKLSKKVSVSVNEQKKPKRKLPKEPKVGVKVNVK